jgi:hypothetical protein
VITQQILLFLVILSVKVYTLFASERSFSNELNIIKLRGILRYGKKQARQTSVTVTLLDRFVRRLPAQTRQYSAPSQPIGIIIILLYSKHAAIAIVMAIVAAIVIAKKT